MMMEKKREKNTAPEKALSLVIEKEEEREERREKREERREKREERRGEKKDTTAGKEEE